MTPGARRPDGCGRADPVAQHGGRGADGRAGRRAWSRTPFRRFCLQCIIGRGAPGGGPCTSATAPIETVLTPRGPVRLVVSRVEGGILLAPRRNPRAARGRGGDRPSDDGRGATQTRSCRPMARCGELSRRAGQGPRRGVPRTAAGARPTGRRMNAGPERPVEGGARHPGRPATGGGPKGKSNAGPRSGRATCGLGRRARGFESAACRVPAHCRRRTGAGLQPAGAGASGYPVRRRAGTCPRWSKGLGRPVREWVADTVAERIPDALGGGPRAPAAATSVSCRFALSRVTDASGPSILCRPA